jgi:hypothetical protein
MDAPRWIVTITALALIALVNFWFFGSRRSG